jgi:beta-N-acetylhexosaminidase
LVTALLFFSGSLVADAAFWTLPDGNPEYNPKIRARQIVATMADDELIGQVLMLGYLGNEPTEEFLEWVKEWNIGGVKVFGWNTGDLSGLARGISDMQKEAVSSSSGIPLFVATDQEGGWVRHVKGETSITPGNMAIGASGIALDAFNSGYIIGRELTTLGINMNFAPTVDVYTNPQAHVIGPRSFSSDPVETAFLAVAYFRGMESAGVISTAKHFPGHGNTDADSHGTLPVIEDALETIWDIDLLPYRMLIKEGLPAIMSGHLNFPMITGNAEPTTLSPTLLREILRNDLSFDGIVITDDMMMYGVRQGGRSIPENCELALRAGNDMIMISRPPEIQAAVRDHLLDRITDDPVFKSQIRSSVERIVSAKLLYVRSKGEAAIYPDPERVLEMLPDQDGRSFFFDLACRSTTIIRPGLLPVTPSGTDNVLLVGYYEEFFSEGISRYENAGTFDIGSSSIGPAALRALLAEAREYDTLIFCLANAGNLGTLKKLEQIGDKIVVLSVHTPVYLAETPWVETAIAVYGTGTDSFKAGFAAIAGDFAPEGRLPIPLSGE